MQCTYFKPCTPVKGDMPPGASVISHCKNNTRTFEPPPPDSRALRGGAGMPRNARELPGNERTPRPALPCILLTATSLAPSILEGWPSLLFFRASGISLAPCFFTWGASLSPTAPATVLTLFTETRKGRHGTDLISFERMTLTNAR